MKNYMNLNQLIKIQVCDFKKCYEFQFRKQIKWIGITLNKEGIFDTFRNRIVPIETLEENNCVLKDNVVLRFPKLVLHFVDKHSVTYTFDTLEEADKYANEIKEMAKGCVWIEVN